MTHFNRAKVSMVAAVLLMALASGSALAQALPKPSIAILDVQRVLRESKAAKSLIPQMEQLRSQFQNEVRRKESALREAGRDLSRQRSLLAPEAFAKKQRDFDQRAKDAQRQVQIRKRELDKAFAASIGAIRLKMIEVARDIANERKINIVLVKSAAILSKTSLDITAGTLKRLDKRLPKVTVKIGAKK